MSPADGADGDSLGHAKLRAVFTRRDQSPIGQLPQELVRPPQVEHLADCD